MLHCSLCFKTKDGPGDKNFFKVPKDEHRRKQWGEICRIDFKKRTAWICKDHFLPSEIIKSGNKRMLMPNTVPFIPPVKGNPGETINANPPTKSKKKQTLKNREGKPISNNTEVQKMEQKLSMEKNREVKPALESSVSNNNIECHHLQENLIMEIPVKKTVFCTRPTQTNTRVCGLVQTSEFSDDFRLNCFYCSDIFPFEKWKDFISHLRNKHSDREKAFEISEYISEDHDYTPINLQITSLRPDFETIGISPESLLPFLGNGEEEPTIPINPTFCYTADEDMAVSGNINILNNLIDSGKPLIGMDSQESSKNLLEPMIANPKFCSTEDDVGTGTLSITENSFKNFNKTDSTSIALPAFELKNKLPKLMKSTQVYTTPQYFRNRNKSSKQTLTLKQTPRKTILSRCLKRTIKPEGTEQEKEEDHKPDISKIDQQKTTDISFEYSPSAIVDLLLDSMGNYPVLWQFNSEPFNDDFSKAIEDLCKIINDNWSLNVDHFTMRRSVNRVLRFYCYLFPNENIENIHPFTCYYDKCAAFLPSSVNEIAYARCSHCYICYRNDFDLKRHLLKEQKFNLKWPYKCVECKQCFTESDEYEFHKRLPHYHEVFRCEPCNKKYFRRNIYNRHISEYHPKDGNEDKYKCDQCDKAYKTQAGLKGHKIYHGERKHKCHLCSKSYHENAKLRIHLKTHRKEYDFMCEVCAKVFVTQSALNVHMNKHTGAKVTCSICNLKLRKSSLSRHLRLLHVAHEGSEASLVRKGKISYKRLVRTGPLLRRKECERRKYQCKICVVNFERYKSLAEHNKELHSDIPRWSCQMCSTEFSLKLNLRRHYRKKHNLHAIQAYKLVEEGEDLNEVLSIKTEQLDRLAENNFCSMKIQQPEVKSEFLSEEDSSQDNIQSFAMQDEIMRAAENITKEEIKIDYMNDFFTDILK